MREQAENEVVHEETTPTTLQEEKNLSRVIIDPSSSIDTPTPIYLGNHSLLFEGIEPSRVGFKTPFGPEREPTEVNSILGGFLRSERKTTDSVKIKIMESMALV